MYNAEYKERFISEREKECILPNGYLRCQFKKVSSMEHELNKDVSNFTFYEIIEYYKLLNTHSANILRVLNSQLSYYTQWCLQHNLVVDGQNHFLEMRTEDYESCINTKLFDLTIVNRSTVLEWVDALPNPKDQLILLGLFEGIKGKDFCELGNLRPEDVNENIVKLYTGRVIQISNKLSSIINDCILEDTYYSTTGKEKKTMPLINKGYVIKDYPNTKDGISEFQRGRQIYNSVQRIMQFIGVYPSISASRIYESGKLHMIKERSEQLGINCIDYINSNHINEVEKKYNCTIMKKYYIIKYKSYLD